MWKFICNRGRRGEKTFNLLEGVVLIGRTHECDIYIPHKSLSRQHAQLESKGGRVTLTDLQSKNGTFVNGARIERCEIHPGDAIKLGELTLSFVGEPISRSPKQAAEEVLLDGLQPTLLRDLREVSFADLLRQAVKSGASETAQRAQVRLRALLDASQLLASQRQMDVLLGDIIGLLFRILQVDRAAILLLHPATGTLQPRLVKSATEGIPPAYSQQIVDYVHSHCVSAIFTDAVMDPRLKASGSILVQSIRACMCVPLRTKDALVGVFYVDSLSEADLFGADDIEFLAAFANQAAIAIENTMLYQRIEEETISRMQSIMDAKLASLNSLMAGIAHELKNPLNFINNFASISMEIAEEVVEGLRGSPSPEVLVGTREDLDMLRGNMRKVVTHGQWATNIINRMLLHAHGGAGIREQVDLNAIVAESIGLAAARMERAGMKIVVETSYDPTLGAAEVLRLELCRVFLNVIENACDAMHAKHRDLGPSYSPRLSIRTAASGDWLEVCIRDNGHGIRPEIAEKIYNPFFTTKPPGEGTGLGLSLSYEIVVQGHQGKMQMHSTPGEFTEFIISLPKRPLVGMKGR